MRVLPRALTLAVLLATALSLAACGSSDEKTESTPAAKAPREGYGGNASGAGNRPKAESKDEGALGSGAAERETGSDGKRRDDKAPETGGRGGGADDVDRPPAGKARRASDCPKNLTAKQCAEAAEAIEKSGNSHPVPVDECPPTLDAATCEEAGRAYVEAEDGSRPVKPNECPRAMTEEECRLAGEAYAEATK